MISNIHNQFVRNKVDVRAWNKADARACQSWMSKQVSPLSHSPPHTHTHTVHFLEKAMTFFNQKKEEKAQLWVDSNCHLHPRLFKADDDQQFCNEWRWKKVWSFLRTTFALIATLIAEWMTGLLDPKERVTNQKKFHGQLISHALDEPSSRPTPPCCQHLTCLLIEVCTLRTCLLLQVTCFGFTETN